MNTLQMDALQTTTRALADIVFSEGLTLIINKDDDELAGHFSNAYHALVRAASELQTITNQYKKTNQQL